MNIENPKPKWTINDALAEIQMVKQMVLGKMGGNDREASDFKTIEQALKKGKITPQLAVELAWGVLNGKQAYH